MSIEDPKFQKIVQNTVTVIYVWDTNILSFSKNLKFCKQEIYKKKKKCQIIDMHVNIEGLTTGLVIPSRTKRPPAVASTQWCK